MNDRTFNVSIRIESDAFYESPGSEIARLLRQAAEWVDGDGICDLPTHPRTLKDVNGNSVGTFQLVGG